MNTLKPMILRSFWSSFSNRFFNFFSHLPLDFAHGSLWKPWIVFLLLSFISRFPYFFHSDIDWDESTFILLGQSVLDGHLPYTDVLDVKPPFLWYGFAVFIFLGGKTFLGVRTLGTIVVATIAYFSYRISKHQWDQRTGWIAGISWIILISLASGGQAVLSEHLALLFLGAGFTLLILYPQGLITFFAVGLLIAMSALVRLNLAYTEFFLGVYLFIRIFITPQRKPQCKQQSLEFIAFCVGGSIVLVLLILPYVLTQNIPLLYTGFIRASLSYTNQNSILSVLWSQFQKVIFLRPSVAAIVLSVVIFWALGVQGRWVWNHRRRLTETQRYFYTLVAIFILSIEFSILRTGAFYSHYTIQFLFFISFLMAKPLEQVISDRLTSTKKLKHYLNISLGCVVLHYLLQYGLILSLWITEGSPFYGASFYIEKVIEEQQVQGKSLWIQTNHLAYWLTNSPPATPAIVHPSNFSKPFLLKAWYGQNASSLTELEKIIDRQPALIVSNGPLETYLRDTPKAQLRLNTVVNEDYQRLDYQYRELRFYRHH